MNRFFNSRNRRIVEERKSGQKNLLVTSWTLEAAELASIFYKKFAGIAAQTPATSRTTYRTITGI